MKTKNISCILLLLCMVMPQYLEGQGILSSQSGKARKYYTQALSTFQQGNLTEAMIMVDKSLKKDEGFVEAYWLKADIYVYQKNWDMQAETLRLALLHGRSAKMQTRLKLGEALYIKGHYQEALELYQYLDKDSKLGDKLNGFVSDKIAKCEFGVRMKANPMPHAPENLGDLLNTKNHDYWPSLRGDETEMVTTVLIPEKSKNGIRYQEDFYSSKLVDGSWTKSVELGKPLNTSSNEGAQCLSPDGNMLFFTACNRFEGTGSCDIFVSFKDGDTWSYPLSPGPPLNTDRWEGHPSVSADGKTIFFSSERSGGKGGRDLWQAEMQIGQAHEITFSNVQNLGDSINTEKHEISPFIHPDGKTLYFSSDGGHMGMGRNDIFIARKQADGSWGKVRNLGYPVNTHNDEIGFIVNAGASLGYFSTEGTDTEESDKDIYSVLLPDDLKPNPVTYLAGNIFDEQNGEPLMASFELYNLDNGELLQQTHASMDGHFFMMLPVGNSYALNVKMPGYLFYSDQFLIPEDFSLKTPFSKDIPLKEISKNQVVILKNILFDFDSWQLKPASRAELENLLGLLNHNPGMRIEISGHTDAVGSETYNKELSEKRAFAVRNYLVDQGIDEQRLTSMGYGAEKPIDADPTASVNRRTEFRVLDL